MRKEQAGIKYYLEMTVVNTWVNRLIGDQRPADKEATSLKRDNGRLGGRPPSADRYTFTTARDYNAQSQLQESGLLGPVTLRAVAESRIE